MKPLRLVMQAFGPYPDREEVDFEYLAQAGIFLIKGPTGSGKTTIFDAMSMALYGKSTGEDDKTKGGRNSLEVWRCNQADWNKETEVTFTFSADGKEYQFIRRLVPKRTKLDPVYAVNVKDEDGIFRTIIENPKEADLNAKAEELIGLNSNQFRQVVLLPQGKFERFLTADSTEKEQILSRLFDAKQWEKYANTFYENASSRKNRLTEEKNSVMVKLQEEDASFTDLDSLEKLIESMRVELDNLEQSHIEFNAEEKKQVLEADKNLANKFALLHKAEKEGLGLAQRIGEIKAKEERAKRAEKAETLREPIKDMEDVAKSYAERKAKAEKLEGMTENIRQAFENSKAALDKHKEESPVDGLNTQIGELNSKKGFYENVDQLMKAASDAEELVQKREAVYLQEKKKAENAVTYAGDCMKQYNQLETKARDYRTGYYAGIYGSIASELEEGQACPICGSKEHPHLAVKDSNSISKEMMEQAEAAAEKGKKAWEAAEEARKNCESNLSKAETEWNDAKALKREADTRYQETTKNLIQGIANSAELERTISSLQKTIEAYEKKTLELMTDLEEKQKAASMHEESLRVSKEELGTAEARYQEQEKKLQTALEKSGYPDVESAKQDILSAEMRNKMLQEITTYTTLVASNKKLVQEQAKEVEGLAEPDQSLFVERQKAIEEEAKYYTSNKTKHTNDIKRLTGKLAELQKLMEHYNANIQQAESDLAFARKLRGDSGIGLQRYVLGIMFNQIIAEANRMLLLVHGGRYQLFRTDDKGAGNKRGLELLVHDNRKPEEKGRPVSSLSGGEKFLVSLSLSIGMSAIAQRSGLQIEALFIDEGFGTLDSSSITDAMDILECVQRSNGMIGIISHVSVLESTINRHLEIVKSEDGSRIRVC